MDPDKENAPTLGRMNARNLSRTGGCDATVLLSASEEKRLAMALDEIAYFQHRIADHAAAAEARAAALLEGRG